MNGIEKEGGTPDCSAHNFPSIQSSGGDTSRQDGNEDFAFRPLYQDADAASGGQIRAFKNKGGPGGNIAIEDVKGESYKRGFEAGKSEACNIVQQELDGPIRQFRDATHHYQDCYAQITETFSDPIVRLTLAIARNILGPQFELDLERHASICQHLQSYLKRHYRLSMILNPDDFKSMSGIMACEDPQWHQSAALRVTSDAATPKGKIEIDSVETIPDSLKDNFNREIDVLLNDR